MIQGVIIFMVIGLVVVYEINLHRNIHRLLDYLEGKDIYELARRCEVVVIFNKVHCKAIEGFSCIQVPGFDGGDRYEVRTKRLKELFEGNKRVYVDTVSITLSTDLMKQFDLLRQRTFLLSVSYRDEELYSVGLEESISRVYNLAY